MNPFEGMSEEQKEYEAVKLANLIDKLHTMGVVKPAKLGEDGKPQVLYKGIYKQSTALQCSSNFKTHYLNTLIIKY